MITCRKIIKEINPLGEPFSHAEAAAIIASANVSSQKNVHYKLPQILVILALASVVLSLLITAAVKFKGRDQQAYLEIASAISEDYVQLWQTLSAFSVTDLTYLKCSNLWNLFWKHCTSGISKHHILCHQRLHFVHLRFLWLDCSEISHRICKQRNSIGLSFRRIWNQHSYRSISE